MGKLRPILFKLDMIVALLDGTKTQTSRLGNRWEKVKAGDWFYVKENFCEVGNYGFIGGWNKSPNYRIYYKTEPQPEPFHNYIWRNKPCIHMFKKDSRILIEVISNEKRKLSSITDEECIAEGIKAIDMHMSSIETPFWKLYSGIRAVTKSPIVSFVSLWNSINAKKEGCSWKDNPYIWMPKFKVLSTTLEETQKLIEGME